MIKMDFINCTTDTVDTREGKNSVYLINYALTLSLSLTTSHGLHLPWTFYGQNNKTETYANCSANEFQFKRYADSIGFARISR